MIIECRNCHNEYATFAQINACIVRGETTTQMLKKIRNKFPLITKQTPQYFSSPKVLTLKAYSIKLNNSAIKQYAK